MTRDNNVKRQAWQLDQRAKSAFFQRKALAWQLVALAEQLDSACTEALLWAGLGITTDAWAITARQNIGPIAVFAHPAVLRQVHGSVAYYRMLAMVSQKSMKNIGFALDAYETGRPLADEPLAQAVALHLNAILSALVEAQPGLTKRDLDVWRGMSAGNSGPRLVAKRKRGACRSGHPRDDPRPSARCGPGCYQRHPKKHCPS